jgi:hypothetical protein
VMLVPLHEGVLGPPQVPQHHRHVTAHTRRTTFDTQSSAQPNIDYVATARASVHGPRAHRLNARERGRVL